jgi:UBX domain-containing protein 6
MLRTKAMREKEEQKSRRRYKYCLIRVRFPDGWVLQGTFSVQEPLAAVSEFVSEHLETPLPHQLADSVSGQRYQEDGLSASLLDLGKWSE